MKQEFALSSMRNCHNAEKRTTRRNSIPICSHETRVLGRFNLRHAFSLSCRRCNFYSQRVKFQSTGECSADENLRNFQRMIGKLFWEKSPESENRFFILRTSLGVFEKKSLQKKCLTLAKLAGLMRRDRVSQYMPILETH